MVDVVENQASIEFIGFLKEEAQTGTQPILFTDEKTLRQILAEQNVAEELVGFTTVNDLVVSLDHHLKNGDQVKIFPLIIGG